MSSRRSKPAPAPRRPQSDDSDLTYECKAAYLVIVDDIDDNLRTKKELIQGKTG